ncbi:YopD family type III secretion system translocon subunit [Photorhabdus heterorhabditis]|uniref:YopD family type III secretion system translocon subunit n=1 Tax=Photorhabdus heterorhabditis TaxID=880156 RepID=UPI0015628873|nr:YopD family type III secretion system translocon subunit [Photorhabdus heterorhabditis]NRN30046.1 YopD family type III secretion system translocon subunit [Photorhabdus heterorhabditis subsp. aluminescens]
MSFIDSVNGHQSITFSNSVDVMVDKSAEPTIHAAAAQQLGKTGFMDKVDLIAPKQALDLSRLGKISQELDSTLNTISLLFEIAKKMRELGILQRDTENKAAIGAQKLQVNEMRHAAMLVIAVAVVFGVMTFFSALMGAFSAVKSSQVVKQQKTLENNIAGRNELIDLKLQQLGKNGDVDRAAVSKVWAKEQLADENALKSLTRVFDSLNSKQQIFSLVMNSLSSMSNNSVQVEQGLSQARAKEHEVDASVAQHEKQKSEDQISLNNNFMRDVLQLLQQLSQSYNQAWRAAAGVV